MANGGEAREMTREEVRREILNAIIECTDHRDEAVVSHVSVAKLLRDAVFQALSAKAMLNVGQDD